MKPNNTQSYSSGNRIPLPTIIAYNSTEQAQRLITKFGYPRAVNVKELETRLAQVIKNFGDEGLKEIAQIHPDKKLILTYNAVKMMEGGSGNGEYYNNTGLPPDPMYFYRDSGVLPTLQEFEDWGDVRYKINYNMADGSGGKKISDMIGAGAIILSLFAFGTALIAFGEKQRR
jgi:hypothetical protein